MMIAEIFKKCQNKFWAYKGLIATNMPIWLIEYSRKRYCKRWVGLLKQLSRLKKAEAGLTLAPIWLPHWPACRWTISLILLNVDELGAGGGLKAEGWRELGGFEWPAGVPPADCPPLPLHHNPAPAGRAEASSASQPG